MGISKFCRRLKLFVKNRNVLSKIKIFCQKSKFFVKNRNFCQKSKFFQRDRKKNVLFSKLASFHIFCQVANWQQRNKISSIWRQFGALTDFLEEIRRNYVILFYFFSQEYYIDAVFQKDQNFFTKNDHIIDFSIRRSSYHFKAQESKNLRAFDIL